MTADNQCLLTDEEIWGHLKLGARNVSDNRLSLEWSEIEITEAMAVFNARRVIQANDEARRKAGWLISPPPPPESEAE